MKKYLILLLALPMLILSGCKDLQTGGVYNGDKVLYDADMVISTSYTLVHSFVKWEYDNRTLLGMTPQVKEYADKLRKTYPLAHQTAIALRNSYAADPSVPNKTALVQALDVLREAVKQANQWIAFGTQNTQATL